MVDYKEKHLFSVFRFKCYNKKLTVKLVEMFFLNNIKLK